MATSCSRHSLYIKHAAYRLYVVGFAPFTDPDVERVPDRRQMVPQIIHRWNLALSPEVLVLGFDGSAE